MSARGQSISRDSIKHLITGGIRVQTLSPVSNILVFLKAIAERCKDIHGEIDSQAAESLGKISLGSEELDCKLGFLCEQLGLVISTKNHRHYSPASLLLLFSGRRLQLHFTSTFWSLYMDIKELKEAADLLMGSSNPRLVFLETFLSLWRMTAETSSALQHK